MSGTGMTSEQPRASSFTTREELLETFEGDAAFVGELVETFLARCPVLLQEIRSALEAGDTITASRSAHSLKGSIGYFENGDACEAALQLERITPQDLPRVPDLMAALESRLGHLAACMRTEFPR
jgi:HPt (histidine-containing phosphotransfer) domain-containing protein